MMARASTSTADDRVDTSQSVEAADYLISVRLCVPPVLRFITATYDPHQVAIRRMIRTINAAHR